jgi:lipopolysaccharide transport system ATP-binding protein
MSKYAIRIENLSKLYRIGSKKEINDTFIGSIGSLVRNPIKNFSQLRRLSTFDESEDSEDIIWALRDVSIDIKRGEVVGIIGRNGAGKSTLLKVLSRITHPTHGRLEMYGRVASLLEVGTGFHQELTGRENIYLNGTILGMTKREIDRKLEEIIDFSGVEKFIDTPVKRYSSGMRVRLAFSVAAHLEPEILLVDEVLSVGDSEFQKKSLGKIGKVASEGRTVLFVSHNLGLVHTLCQRGVILDKGGIEFSGEASTAIKMYQNKSNMSDDRTQDSKNVIEFYDTKINGEKYVSLHPSDSITIRCNIVVRREIPAFQLFGLLSDPDGRLILHARIDQKGLVALSNPGTYSIELRIPPLSLKPNMYEFYFKFIPEMLDDNIYRVFSDTVAIDVSADLPPEMLLGMLTPEIDWQIDSMSADID